MNLPASATSFLPAFKGLCAADAWHDWPLPTIHCYTFARGEENLHETVEEARAQLGTEEDFDPSMLEVRSVAPDKLMLRLTFTLPADVAFHGTAMRKQQKMAPE